MDNDFLRPEAFFDLGDTFTASFFEGCDTVWQAIPISAVMSRD
ncbi:MAG: hypothetical protein R3C44_01745 [Chloroflexota bacterium]